MRRTAWPALACVALVPLLFVVSGTPAGRSVDDQLSEAMASWPGSDAEWDAASWPGLTLAGALVLACCALGCALLRDGRAALLSLAAGIVVPAIHLLKDLFQRARPDEAVADGFAYPSGHAAIAMAAYGIVAVLLVPAALRHGAPRWLGPAATGLWLGLALGVGAARVAAHQHWPIDVLGGWALGGAIVAAAWWAQGWRRRSTETADPAEGPTQPAL